MLYLSPLPGKQARSYGGGGGKERPTWIDRDREEEPTDGTGYEHRNDLSFM